MAVVLDVGASRVLAPPDVLLGAIGFQAESFRHGAASGPGLQVSDPIGDGVLDLAYAATRDEAVAVWRGGPSLVADPFPSAVLQSEVVPDSLTLGVAAPGSTPALQCADVTGDGVADVLALGSLLDVDGIDETGGIFLWDPKALLATLPDGRGTLLVFPTMTLASPDPAPSDRLGQ